MMELKVKSNPRNAAVRRRLEVYCPKCAAMLFLKPMPICYVNITTYVFTHNKVILFELKFSLAIW